MRRAAALAAGLVTALACGVKAPPRPPAPSVRPERSAGDAGAESKGGTLTPTSSSTSTSTSTDGGTP